MRTRTAAGMLTIGALTTSACGGAAAFGAGLFAAIAVPAASSFNERTVSSATDAAVESDLRNAATAMETYFSENGEYDGATVAYLTEEAGFNPTVGVTTNVVSTEDFGYCLSATHESGLTLYFDGYEAFSVTDIPCG